MRSKIVGTVLALLFPMLSFASGTYTTSQYKDGVAQNCFEYTNSDSGIADGIKKTCSLPELKITCVVKDNEKCSATGAKVECDRPPGDPVLPYRSVFYRDIGGWPSSFKKEQCKGGSMDNQLITPTSTDRLKGRIHLTQYGYSQLAIRSIHYRLPSESLDYKAIENQVPAHAIGPYSQAQYENGEFKDLKTAPPKLLEWIPKAEKPSMSGPSTYYKSLECLSSRSSEFPTAKYILTEYSSSSMLAKGYMQVSGKQSLLEDFDQTPQWLVEACDKHLKSAPPRSGVYVVSKFSLINPLIGSVLDTSTQRSPKEIFEMLNVLDKQGHLTELFVLAGPSNSNVRIRFLALLKLAKEDRLLNLPEEISYIAPKNLPDFEAFLRSILQTSDSKTQLRLKPFEEAVFNAAVFSNKYPRCKDSTTRKTPQIKLINGEFKTACGNTSPETAENIKKYTVPAFCAPNADLKMDFVKAAPPPYNIQDSCNMRGGGGGTTASCLEGYQLDVRPGPDQCVPN